MRRLPSLAALRAFEAAARHGSFRRAAEELAVTPTAISHHVRGLEDHIGLALFERRTRHVVLTGPGEQLLPVLRDGFDAFAAAIDRLRAPGERGHVTITTTRAFGAHWLLPRVARFQAAHPAIDLRLHASDELVAPGRGTIDLAIRYGRGPYPGLAAELLFADRFAVVANPLLELAVPADVSRVPLIAFDWQHPHPDNPTWAHWFDAAGIAPAGSGAALRFSDESHAVQAAVAGQGAALLSLALVADDIAAGRLAPLGAVRLPGHGYHLLTATGALTAQARAARQWLIAEASAMTTST